MELKEKHAIVTGVSRGIGQSIAMALLEEGAYVAGWSRNEPDIPHPNFHFLKTDVSKLAEVESSFRETAKIFSNRVDILINNSGFGVFGKVEDLPVRDWEQMFATNVHGIFYCTRKVVPLMKTAQSGHIVNIASIAGTTGFEEGSGYCATKFAVRGISQSLFKELRKDNIKVSCIYPGSVNTNFFDEVKNVTANETMLHPTDVAALIIHILKTPDNFLTVDVEIRPMNARYS